MIRVVDASVVIDAVLPTARQEAALGGLIGHELWAPAILDLEVTSALARLERGDRISPQQATTALDRLADAPIRRLAIDRLVPAAWALRAAVRMSDAYYVAATLHLGADLLTSDARLARAPVRGLAVVVIR